MKKKILFVSDLDGTLLNEQSKVSNVTADILSDLIENNYLHFTIATARTPATAIPLTKEIGINLPMIVMTGAAMWNPASNSYIYSTKIDIKKVDKIVEICEEHDVNPFVYTIDHNLLKVYHSDKVNPWERKFISERVNSPFKHFILAPKREKNDAILIFVYDTFEKVNKINKAVSETIECESICYHDIFSEELGFLEIFAPGVSKANAIEALADTINADETVVFGDNLNDISMLKRANIGVAVGNAFPEVKKIADQIIGPNTSDSVAIWIKDNNETI